jgi:hypothetical protein
MSENSTQSTQMPIPLVDADKLPHEKAWNYTDIAGIVGNLYLESHKRVAIMEEQVQAMISEYKRKINELERNLGMATEENMKLRKELEKRNVSQ